MPAFPPIPWRRSSQVEGPPRRPVFRNATIYAVGYFIGLILLLDSARNFGLGFLMGAAPVAWVVGAIIWKLMPLSWFYDPGGKLAYSPKMSGLIRFLFYSLLFVGINVMEILTGIWIGGYIALLWFVPLVYVFPYLMLLREIFQHANADEGEISNSRVIHVDPLTRWALFGYGNDVHIVHHIYPNIPHYHLADVHREMCEKSEEYRDNVEEAYGMIGTERQGHSAVEALAVSKEDRVSEEDSTA